MDIFQCQHCEQTVFFENTHCESCQSALGFLASEMQLMTLSKHNKGMNAYDNPNLQLKYCSNFHQGGCNWLLPFDSMDTLCLACDLNNQIPDLNSEQHRDAWVNIERAKHRLIYDLLQLGLTVISKNRNPESGLSFNFLSDDLMQTGNQVITGHMQGLITLNTAEANAAEREKMKAQMEEPYRTLIGHLRHEVGHYYWDLLIRPNNERLDAYRSLFGDDSQNYQRSLDTYYQTGPAANWRTQFVSAYASCHPWEDWAETWAHYLHLMSTLHTAKVYGLSLQPDIGTSSGQAPSMALQLDFNVLEEIDINLILSAWLKLTMAVNSLNRSMGQPDLYPFVLSSKVKEKLGFVHQVITEQRHQKDQR